MKKWLLMVLAIGLLCGCGVKKEYLQIGTIKVAIETKNTPEGRAQGLSGREKLGKNEGMFFIFDVPAKYDFWMKEMQFPLDFVWIRGDEVVEVTENVDINRMDLKPKMAVDKVLEVNSGWVKENKIKIGDKISL